MKGKIQKTYLILVILIIGSIAIGYSEYRNYRLKKYGITLEKELTMTKNDFALTEKKLNTISQELLQTKTDRDIFEQKYNYEKNRMDFLASQVSGIQGTVGFLEKLRETDTELLQKYSKVYFLNENYIPQTLVKINPEYTLDSKKDYLFYSRTWPFLQNLMSKVTDENIDIKIISAYRSFGSQGEIKSAYEIIYGSGANQFSSDQGYSEHQLGTTVDFTTSEIKASFSGFEKTATYQWLKNNAYKYGFILSYPENNSYYQFEPWHWRFIGRSLAENLHKENKNFYDLDQHEIDQYLLFFFD